MEEDTVLKAGIILFSTVLVLVFLQLPIVGRFIAPRPINPCGDGHCDFYLGENMQTCSEDCSRYCGDGVCSPTEYKCIEGWERICEQDCGECPPDMSSEGFVPMCIGDLKRYENWCWWDEGMVIVDPMLKGARDYGQATVVTWIKNSGGQRLQGLSHQVFCEPEYEHLKTSLQKDILEPGMSAPLVLKFEELNQTWKKVHHCMVRVVSEEPGQVYEREFTVRFV